MSAYNNIKIPQLNCYCLKLRKASNRVLRFYDNVLASTGINSHQFTLLVVLQEKGPLSVTEFASEIGLDRTTLSRNLKILENRGIVEDIAEKGRKRKIGISQQGLEVLKNAKILWAEAQQRFQTFLGEKQCEQLLEQLEKISSLEQA